MLLPATSVCTGYNVSKLLHSPLHSQFITLKLQANSVRFCGQNLCLRGRDSLFFRLQWIQTLVFWAGIVWNIALGHSLQHSHPIRATVYILSCSISPSSLLIPQVGEQWRMAWEHGSQHLCETPGWIFRLPPLVRSISSCCNHSENEPADGRSLFLSLPLPLSL